MERTIQVEVKSTEPQELTIKGSFQVPEKYILLDGKVDVTKVKDIVKLYVEKELFALEGSRTITASVLESGLPPIVWTLSQGVLPWELARVL